ncbi:MAG TPA: spore germination protein [Spirochaetia bacterium]|nr:spore germination protein [Spirochaetia bacterium]
MSGFFRFGKTRDKEGPVSGSPPEERPDFREDELARVPVVRDLDQNLARLREIIGASYDAVFRRFRVALLDGLPCAIIFLDNMVNTADVQDTVLRPLMFESTLAGHPGGRDPLQVIRDYLLGVPETMAIRNLAELFTYLMSGCVILMIQGEEMALALSLKAYPQRPVGTSEIEPAVRGPREAFTENIAVNTSLVRKRLKTPNLTAESLTLGTVSRTTVVVMYVRGLVDPKLVAEVKKRLTRIKIDAILESGYLEELIQDNPYSPFPQLGNTERPDRIAAALLEGRVALFTDGTPTVLWLPVRFTDLIQVPEDYYQNYYFASAIRILRFFAFWMAIALPSFYIAVITYHQEMIPTRIFESIAASREGIPFPTVVEALLLEAATEMLREAGIRLPVLVGQAVSIVGALILGQVAVTASLVSPQMVIVVALALMASFMLPTYNTGLTLRLLRFPLMIMAALWGLFGLMGGLFLILMHMLSLRSFGAAYYGPFAPFEPSGMKDTFVRAPWWAMTLRPRQIAKENVRRQQPDWLARPGRDN